MNTFWTKTRVAAVTGAAVALMATTLAGGPAQAAEQEGKHCWSEEDTGRSLCASTESRLAIDMYEQYGVTLQARAGEVLPTSVTAPSAHAKRVVDSARRAALDATAGPTPRASYLLVKAFEDEGYKGYSRIWSVSLQDAPCRLQQNYAYGQYAYMYNYSFNDRMASYQLAPGCRLKVYADANFRGTMRGPNGNSSSLGILYRQVSSMSIVK